MKYSIRYNYDTGDSFTSHTGLEDTLEVTWENLEVAKANLKRIEEHYKMYKILNGYDWDKTKKSEAIVEESKDKDWFVKGDKWSYEYCIILYTDEGKPWQLHAPWCGYFESLNSVEIEADQSDLKICF